MTLGERISNLRKAKYLSQEDLASILNISRQAVYKWESDQSTPELDKLVALSNIFDISLDELVKGDKPMAADNAEGVSNQVKTKDFSDLQKQDMDGGKKKRSMKAAYIAYRTIQIAVLLYFAHEMYLRITTGRPISNLLIYFLLLTAPAKIYKNIEARNAHKGNAEELKKHDKMTFRLVMIAIGMMTVVIAVTVLCH